MTVAKLHMVRQLLEVHNEPAMTEALPARPDGLAPSNGIDQGATPWETPHLVIKRGQLGRYRFSFFFDGGRLSGDIRIEDRGVDRAGRDAVAREEIRKIVTALLAALG